LRRCANAGVHERDELGGGAGAGGASTTSAESTFGSGWKTVRDTLRSTRTSHDS
jgi:hypothetical protein